MSGWWKSLPNGLPNVVSPPKSGHRRAAKGMEFPWRCNVDTIAMDLKVSWEISVYSAIPDLHPPKRTGWTASRMQKSALCPGHRGQAGFLERPRGDSLVQPALLMVHALYYLSVND